MKHFIINSILLFFFLPGTFTQDGNPVENKEFFNEGEYFFNRGEYEEAIFYYLKLLKYQPDNANFNFKIGESYLNVPGKEALAIPYFEKAVKNTTEKNKYKKNSFEENEAPLHAYFYLGNAFRYGHRLNDALEAYKTFVNSPFYAGNYNVTIVENEIKSCERAKIIEDNPVSFNEIPLGEKINTGATEFRPVVSGDEKSFVFVRRLKFYDAVFYCTLKEDGWSAPVNINPQIISDGDYYPASLSYKGDELYLVRTINENSDIYVSRFIDGTWSKAEKLGKEINSLANESHAAVTADGKTLFVASDRGGGKGGFDVYISKRTADSWSKLKNIGKVINTSFDEISPFPVNNGKMLFFSSNGHYNMGGFDIFYSIYENKAWREPVNIGSPINSTGDNKFYQPLSGNRAYISRISQEDGNEDIFELQINTYFPKY